LAIVQISQITNRLGINSNLPQLAGAELGWSTDTRQLYIGNGTLAQGAPVIGNTEILTEFSDILAFTNTYTYKGQAAGYTVQTGPTPGTPVSQSLQTWLDQFASVTDFGAVGDGVTDDTAAINRALYQLYCREVNPQVRRSLFFPAGTYLVSGTINIPPYAMLYGEGTNSSVISLVNNGGAVPYVAQTADSLQQTGANIGSNGAVPPQYVNISNLGFRSADPLSSVFLVGQAKNCHFQNVGFYGPLTTTNLTTNANNTVGVDFKSTTSLICTEIVFDGCVFTGTVYAVNTGQQLQGIVFTNGKFITLYQGIVLGNGTVTNGGPTGVRIIGNFFNTIFLEGIVFGSSSNNIQLNASGHNVFYDVGNQFTGVTGTPSAPNINIYNSNNLSISDLFQRTPDFATIYPCVQLNDTASIATTNGSQLSMGTYTRQSGSKIDIVNNTTATVLTISATQAKAFSFNYTIIRGTGYQTGTVIVSSNGASADLNWSQDYVENETTGVALAVSQSGNNITVQYTSNNTGIPGIINYSVTYLS
jgi:hypothetical protein